MAPVFQGIINKWVKINQHHSEASDLKYPSDVYGSKLLDHRQLKKDGDNSIRTADETATFDSSPLQQRKQKIIKVESSTVTHKEHVTKTLQSNRRLSYQGLKKLAISNSYSDLVRKKRDGAIPIPQDSEENKNADDECLGVSLEELFNPLATDSDRFYQEGCSVEICNATHEKLSYEKRLKLDNSHMPTFILPSPEEGYDNCMEMNQKLQELLHLTEYVNSRKDTTCEHCQKVITTTLKELNSIQVKNDLHCHPHFSEISVSLSLPVPIQSLRQDQNSHHHVEESIALMESSQRLSDFMNLHKTRITQLTQEKESKQRRLNTKLSDFTSMCQMIREEMSLTQTSTDNAKEREHSTSNNAHYMLLQLEREIELLKTQQIVSNEPRTSTFQGTELITTRHDLISESFLIPSSKNHNSSDDINSEFQLYYASDVGSCVSDAETSHTSHGLMFSLDDEF